MVGDRKARKGSRYGHPSYRSIVASIDLSSDREAARQNPDDGR